MIAADKARVKALLGKTFGGTIITDPVLEPFIIVRYEDGGFAVFKVRGEGSDLRLTTLCYPSNFGSCLDRIAKEIHHSDGKTYDSLKEYIDDWKQVSERVRTALVDYNIPEV